jgi:hypothetical protein
VWAIAAGPVDVSAWAAAYDKPELGAAVDAAGRQLAWGHLTLTLTGGRLHPVRVGGEVAGVFFSGTGRLRYVSTDPVESAIYRRNAEKASDYRVDANGAIEDTVTEALVFLSSGVPDAVSSGGAAPREHAAALEAHLERFAYDATPRYRQLMAQARIDPPAQPLVVVEIRAGRDDLFYMHDTLRDGEESIGPLRKLNIRPGIDSMATSGRWRLLERLSRQPIGRTRLDVVQVPWVMRELDATVVNPRGDRLEVETRQVFEARRRVRVLDLSLTTNFQVDDESGDLKYALDAVEDGAGHALAVARRWTDVLVQLPAPLEPGQKVALTFRMSGDVLYRPMRDNYWAMNGGWYPAGHEIPNSAFTYHAIVKVPKPFTPFTSASTVKRWEEGNLVCGEFTQAKPIWSADLLAGKYTTFVDAREGLTVRVSSYALNKPGASKQIASIVHAFAAFYEPLLGKFPFPELEVLEINAFGFGIAPPGMIFITREAFNPLFTQGFVKGINARLAHEVAHAWWGHVVRPSATADRWMAESLAEYYSGLAMQLRNKNDFGLMLDEWKDESKPVRGRGSVYLANSVAGEDRGLEYQALLYAKGPLVLHALRLEIGDQAFFTVFKSLLSSFPMKDATTKDVIAITNLVTKKDYGPWFDRYLLGTEWPALEKGKQD